MKYLLFLTFLIATCAKAQVDVVFDLDWTLVYSVDASMADEPRVYKIEGKYYRLADGAEEVVAELVSNPRTRVSFFSGGERSRNEKLLKSIFLPGSNKSFYEASHRILSKRDLTVLSTDESLAFTDRYKKDLTKVNPDLEKVVLIDDLKDFAPQGQRRNVFWLGKTYTFSPTFADAGFTSYAPKSELAWLHERNKLFWSMSAIEEALERSAKSGKGFVTEMREVVKLKSPNFPTMKGLRDAQTLATRLKEKHGVPYRAPNSSLGCFSFFFP